MTAMPSCGKSMSCPHARGGVPDRRIPYTQPGTVVPTHVGVYPGVGRSPEGDPRCPHARGGVPSSTACCRAKPRLSPRTWGCTEVGQTKATGSFVVPTHVGVYRWWRMPSRWHATLSPRTWGCTVQGRAATRPFCRCPHARGGVPRPGTLEVPRRQLSPRTWGCTGNPCVPTDTLLVVPTDVGVYRISSRARHRGRRCPHARRGVPNFALGTFAQGLVVPTHVGVYRDSAARRAAPSRCPHPRGGCTDVAGLLQAAQEVVPTHVGV